MASLLRHALGPLAPQGLSHQRPGIAPGTPLGASPGDRSEAPSNSTRTGGGGGVVAVRAWGLGGRGDAWRERSAPASVLGRLASENALDLRLYHAAAAIARDRARALRH
jgi:hypothetical protein